MTDVIEARSSSEAADILRERGLFVTQIDQVEDDSYHISLPSGKDPQSGVKTQDIVFFTQQMSMLIRSGARVVQALEAIEEQCQRAAWRRVVHLIRMDVEEGKPLSKALGQFSRLFPGVFTNMIAAGEASGDLGLAFDRLALLTRQQQEIKNRIVGTLIYPAVLLSLCFGVVCTLFIFVLPRFAEMFETLEVELPVTTKIMITTSNWSLANWYYLLGVFLIIVAGVYMYVKSPGGRQSISQASVRVPMFGKIVCNVLMARIFRVWGQLLESKVGLLDAVRLVIDSTSNPDFRELLENLAQTITDGNSVGPVLRESWLVPRTFSAAIVTGEESGKLGASLLFVAGCLEEDNAQVLSSLTRIIEPIILIFMGLIVGTVAISLFMPMFDMATIAGG
jgi:type II secretory pathway component PulF